MMEILRSWFTQYRFVPYTELKLDMQTNAPKAVESHIHAILKHKQWTPDEKVSGGTEMFIDIDQFRVIQYLKHCGEYMTDIPLELSPKDYRHLRELISP